VRRGRDGAQTPRLVVLERLQQLLTGVQYKGPQAATGSRIGSPPRIRVTIAAIVLLWLEWHCKRALVASRAPATASRISGPFSLLKRGELVLEASHRVAV
jgi:hypothetical protein